MADAGAGGNHAEIVKRFLSPAQKNIAFAVALIFNIGIEDESAIRAELIHLNGMVDHEIHRNKRIDLFVGGAAQFVHSVAHGGQIHNRGHAREILHEHTRRSKSDFLVPCAGVFRGLGQATDMDLFCFHKPSVLVAQKVLDHHFDGKREFREKSTPAFLANVGKAKDFVGITIDRKARLAAERIFGGHICKIILTRSRELNFVLDKCLYFR